jgi:hypothetical protein
MSNTDPTKSRGVNPYSRGGTAVSVSYKRRENVHYYLRMGKTYRYNTISTVHILSNKVKRSHM